MDALREFLEVLAYSGEPLGMHYTDQAPGEGVHPKPAPLPTRAEEAAGSADLGACWANWSCVLGHLRVARRKGVPAWFDREHFGCLGAAFYLGFNNPQLENIIHYVSTGIPGRLEGEHYFESPGRARDFMAWAAPPPAPARYCVFQPLPRYGHDERPLLVSYFARPETLAALHQLVYFVTGDLDNIASPMGAGCTNLVSAPLRFLAGGRPRAVLSGWDTSCRKFLDVDELILTVPFAFHVQMLGRWKESFLGRGKEWALARKKAEKSREAWARKPGGEG